MRKQRGMSAISILCVILLALAVVKTGMAVLPMYLDYYMIGTILDKMHEHAELRSERDPKKLRDIFEARLDQNNITIPTTDLIIHQSGTGLVFDWKYEQREPWLGNIDLVGSFQRTKEF